ncbi:POK10 protein, partial [Eurystomus gularis]|nr:POK10 protein [Eurystomus gularis]
LGQGNAIADSLVTPAIPEVVDNFLKARSSHDMFQQGARVLSRQFQISEKDARGIVRTCTQCSQNGAGLGIGVNPKGLQACDIWQMDVTHVSEFGRQKYVHVTIDTFSKVIWATAQ